MPELPEVETVARQLAPLLNGRRIVELSVFDQRLAFAGSELVAGCRIMDVFRVGKEVVLELAPRAGERSKRVWLLIHLRMTGRLIRHTGRAVYDTKHLRARFKLDRGNLLFYDIRRFGVFRLSDSLEYKGLDPMSAGFTLEVLDALLKGSSQAIKPWLLRQDRLVGLGNIYASEILFAAGLDPTREAGSLDRDEIKRLHRSTRDVLRRAIKFCGTTFSDFQDSQGQSGSFQNYLKVYGREDEKCKKCGSPILRVTQQQRSTFYCGNCQS